MANPRVDDAKITTEEEARKAASGLKMYLSDKQIPCVISAEGDADELMFGVDRDGLNDNSIIEVVKAFDAAKKTHADALSNDLLAWQERVDTILKVLKTTSANFLLAYEAEIYKEKYEKARDSKDENRMTLHSNKRDGLKLYRRFLPRFGMDKKDQDQKIFITDAKGEKVKFPDEKTELTAGNDDQHVKDRMSCIKHKYPRMFEARFGSHVKDIIDQAETIYRSTYPSS